METFRQRLRVNEGERVIDLGGHPSIWQFFEKPLQITILNLPRNVERAETSHHQIRYLEGDACDLTRFDTGEFDIVFSNSVIEHVGPEGRQRDFAQEARRVGRACWVQTPAKWFPIEAHCGMPFWWFYPTPLKQALLRRWRRKLPDWTEMIETTRVLEKRWLRELFPEASIWTERFLGIPKSYTAYWSNDLLESPQHP